MESVHFVPDQCANFASHFSSVKIFQIDLFNFASHFICVQIFQIYFSLKNEKFLFPISHYNFCIVHWGSPFFSIQPYFHCPAVWSSDIVQLHPTVYYIPSSTLTLSFYKISHRETFVNSLTVYWHHLRNIRILCVIFVCQHTHRKIAIASKQL